MKKGGLWAERYAERARHNFKSFKCMKCLTVMTLLLKFTESNNTKFTKYKPIQKSHPFSHSQLFEKDCHYLMVVCQDALRIVIR